MKKRVSPSMPFVKIDKEHLKRYLTELGFVELSDDGTFVLLDVLKSDNEENDYNFIQYKNGEVSIVIDTCFYNESRSERKPSLRTKYEFPHIKSYAQLCLLVAALSGNLHQPYLKK